MSPDSECLGIAIDHRIRQLIKPVEYLLPDETGNHISILDARGQRLGRPKAERDVTTELASPHSIGGIAVVLQQPRNDHPFQSGARAVVEDCATLRALKEVFFALSGERLKLLRDISIIDLLPYTTDDNWKEMSNEEKERSFEAAQRALAAKAPDVVLCMGKKYLERNLGNLKGDMWKLESQGVGAVFNEKYPHVTVNDTDGNRIKVRRVNGFHPSYAMNYLPEHSCLRQLLFLVVAQTCAVYNETSWKEEDWIKTLRRNCAALFEGSECETAKKYIPDYVEDYSELLLNDILGGISKIAKHKATGSARNHPRDLYKLVVSSRLSERLNDASLLIAKISELQAVPSPGWAVRRNADALQLAAKTTSRLSVLAGDWEDDDWQGATRLKVKVLPAIAELDKCVIHGRKLKLDLQKTRRVFVDLAVGIEGTLGHILNEEKVRKRREEEADQAELASLAVHMGDLSIR